MNDDHENAPGNGGDGQPDGSKNDLLRGAAAIAGELLGDADKRRTIYHLVATTKIPVFRLGTMICARRTVLRKWISDQEGRVPPGIGGHHRRRDKPDEPTAAPACPLPRPRGPVPTDAAGAEVPRG